MREFNTIQEKILDKTLFLVSQKGSYDVSVRDITREAGVNVNAINYYFGNKDNLLEKMDEFVIDNYIASYSVLDEDLDDENKLLLWANEVMEYTLQYPGIPFVFRSSLNSERSSKIKEFLEEKGVLLKEKVDELLKSIFCVEDESLQLARILLDSAVVYPAIFGIGFEFDVTKIKEKSYRHHYLKFAINTIKKGIVNHEKI